jgi:hypothetical protein
MSDRGHLRGLRSAGRHRRQWFWKRKHDSYEARHVRKRRRIISLGNDARFADESRPVWEV